MRPLSILWSSAQSALALLFLSTPAHTGEGRSEVAPLPSSRLEIYATSNNNLIYTGGGKSESRKAADRFHDV